MSKLLLAAAAALACAGPASAFTYFSVGATTGAAPGDPGPLAGETTLVTFDGAAAPGVMESDSGNVALYTGTSSIAAAPAGDTTQYEAIGPGGAATFDFTGYEAGHTVGSVSVYLGSIDTFNTLTAYSATGSVIGVINGDQLPAASGDQGAAITNRRVYLSFLPSDDFAKLVFSSTGTAFEYDDIAAGPATYNYVKPGSVFPTSPTPEPAAWALMALGVGGIGASLRRRKAFVAA